MHRRSECDRLFPERVDDQVDLLQTELPIEVPAERDHLDIEVRVIGTENLDPDLVELPVATALRSLVPEDGPGRDRGSRCR